VKWAVQQKPYFAPGKSWHYSNTNYLLLGLIIEKLTNETVGNEIRKRLIVPFGLTQTTYPQTEAMPEPWARSYGLDKQRNWVDVSNTIPVAFMDSAGEMISDMADMRRWVKLYARAARLQHGGLLQPRNRYDDRRVDDVSSRSAAGRRGERHLPRHRTDYDA
jgi:D-alanyl-D-alanine carboxypeptidase